MKTTLPLPALLCRYLLSLLALLPLAAAATGPVLTLQGTGGSGTDVTAFVDQVEIVNVATGAVVGGALANAGFETPSQAGVTGGYSYAPSGGAWTFGPAAGIARNGSVFGNPTAPEGSQVGLVQYTSSLQQALVLGAGTYQVRLRLAQRTCCGSHDQEVQVKVNNVVLGTVTPATVFTTYTTSSFTVFEVASLNPAANARAASRNTAVGVTFTGPVDAATAGTIKVFSAQYRGRRTATASTSGSTVTLTPTANSGAASFRPGETVQVSVPATVHGASGAAAGPYVYQFTAAVGGTGSGRFTAPATNPSSGVGNNPNSVVVGDVDGDGDLDMLTTNQNSNSVSVRLNDGTGNFTPLATNPDPAVGSAPTSVALGDVDGDGDLDFLTANNGSSTVSVRLNNGMGSFTAPATNPNPAVGNGPLSVALGDVDGDGDLDVLTANYGGTVSVRLNDGTGNFTAPATNPDPAVGSVPISIALGDVDGDGDLDVLTANYGDNTVSVRLNDGTGNFTPPATNPDPAVGSAPISVALGDVDGDGDLDLLTANVGDNTVSVRLNDGTGSFTAPATNPNPAVGNGPLSVALGDVDGDGDLDMLAANSGDNTVSVRLNDGIGNFTAPATNPNPAVGNGPQGVALGDVDGDGDLDALTANFYDNAVSVRLNQPPPPVLSSLSASSAAAGGALTLSGTFLTGATVATFTNTGTGAVTTVVAAAFTSTGYAVTPQTIGLLVPTSLAVGSYTVRVTTPGGTSNALPLTVRLLAVASLSPAANARAAARSTSVGVTFTGTVDAATAGTIKVFSAQYRGRRTTAVSTSGNTVTLTPTASSGAAAFKPGETVRVSVPATVHSTGGAAAVPYVYQFTTAVGGTGIGNFRAPAANADPAVGNSPQSVAVGDVDGDGDLDMLTANSGSSTVSVRLNDGSGSFSAPATNPNPAVGSGPGSVVLGDVDGDGDLDMLTANANDNTVSVRLNNGTGNFTAPATNPNPAVGSSPGSLALGDVDGDGDLDMLTANFGGNTVSVRLNDGTGNFTAPATNANPTVGSGPISVALGDVDGDGDLDLLTANYGGSTVSVRLNDGTGNFTPPATNPNPALGTAPYSVALGDVDGDGDLDLLAANSGSNTVSVRLNNGTGSFTGGSDPAVGSTPYSVALSDVDADGDLDLLTANHGGNTLSVRLNDGSGSFTAPATNANPAVGSYPTSVALGDVDGDGDLDVLTANSADNTVSVRLNQSAPPVLSSLSASSVVAGGALTLSGTLLTGATLVTFTNTGTGAATTVAASAFTSTGYAASPQTIGLLVPGLAAGSYAVSVTTPNGPSNTLPLSVRPLLVTSLNPAANARAAARSTPVGVTFTEPIDAATAGYVKVFSAQYRGRRTASASTSGNTVTLAPTASSGAAAFKPGETVQVSVPATVHSTGGAAAVPYVYQFTTAVGGTGRGNFRAPAANANPAVGSYPTSVALGDVDGDGDLDVLTANSADNTVSVRLNDGAGNFTGGSDPIVGSNPGSVVLGDVDGDGDLDLLTANFGSNTVSVRLNDGTGNFTAPATNPNPAVGSNPSGLALGDVDGDGDLDVLAANYNGNTVSVRLNDGAGNFTAPATNPNPTVDSGPQ
ncbi:MAG: beta strand repeat-containing protein, partial [Janthinobacterium lividum]